MKKVIYLAGPINKCSDAEAKDWRELIKASLNDTFDFLDPMRRDYRGKEAESVNEIVRGDMVDIECSNIFLAFVPKPSVGTSMEIFYAFYTLGKKVYLICEDPKPSPWLVRFSDVIFKSIEEAIEFFNATTPARVRL